MMRTAYALMRTQTPKYARPHTCILFSNSFFKCYFFTTYDSDEHILQFECCYHTMVSNCCWSLYLNIAGLRQGPGKCFWGPGKVLEFFVTKRVGSWEPCFHLQTDGVTTPSRALDSAAAAGFDASPGELWSLVIYPYSAYSAKLNVDGQLVPKFEWKQTDGHDRLQYLPGSKYVIDFVVTRRFFGTVYVCCII